MSHINTFPFGRTCMWIGAMAGKPAGVLIGCTLLHSPMAFGAAATNAVTPRTRAESSVSAAITTMRADTVDQRWYVFTLMTASLVRADHRALRCSRDAGAHRPIGGPCASPSGNQRGHRNSSSQLVDHRCVSQPS